MVECLLETEGPRVQASPTSLRCGFWARHIYLSLVLVQPRKTRPYITERFMMGRKESNQTNTYFYLYKQVDPDEIQPNAAFHLGLHCLQKYMFRFFSKYKGFIYWHLRGVERKGWNLIVLFLEEDSQEISSLIYIEHLPSAATFNSLPAFVISFTDSSNSDQGRQNVESDLDLNCLTLWC